MKRLISVILILISVFILVGCKDYVNKKDTVVPVQKVNNSLTDTVWVWVNNPNYEVCEIYFAFESNTMAVLIYSEADNFIALKCSYDYDGNTLHTYNITLTDAGKFYTSAGGINPLAVGTEGYDSCYIYVNQMVLDQSMFFEKVK